MKYAVISIQGHQYKVTSGEEILVDKLTGEPKADVLLMVDDDKVSVGNPTVKDAKVVLKTLAEEKGEKISVFKYKAKSRYRKKTGFRSKLTRLKVDSINL